MGLGMQIAFVPLATALAIGTVGGALFHALSLPLPWMLGAMIFNLVAVLCGVRVQGPERARGAVSAVIGVMLGSGFHPELLGQLGDWALSLSFLAAYLAISAAIVVPFYRRVAGMDPVTAFFSAMPGGLTDMVLIGEEMGGDARRIALAHAARIVLAIGAIALLFRVWLGLDLTGVTSASPVPLGLRDVVLLTASGALGLVLGRWAGLPAPFLLGPMIVSAAVHMLGWTSGDVPGWLVGFAQLMLGTMIGCRFLGTPATLVLSALAYAAGATGLVLVVSAAFAFGFHGLFGQSVSQVFLAYAPGGVTEMSLIALSSGGDVAYVSVHHIVRISMLVAIAPLLGRIWRRGQTE